MVFYNHDSSFQRSNSVPEMDVSEAIMEELGIDKETKVDPMYQYELDLLKRESDRRQDQVFLRF